MQLLPRVATATNNFRLGTRRATHFSLGIRSFRAGSFRLFFCSRLRSYESAPPELEVEPRQRLQKTRKPTFPPCCGELLELQTYAITLTPAPVRPFPQPRP